MKPYSSPQSSITAHSFIQFLTSINTREAPALNNEILVVAMDFRRGGPSPFKVSKSLNKKPK
jgi:hypothetical protein